MYMVMRKCILVERMWELVFRGIKVFGSCVDCALTIGNASVMTVTVKRVV